MLPASIRGVSQGVLVRASPHCVSSRLASVAILGTVGGAAGPELVSSAWGLPVVMGCGRMAGMVVPAPGCVPQSRRDTAFDATFDPIVINAHLSAAICLFAALIGGDVPERAERHCAHRQWLASSGCSAATGSGRPSFISS